MGYEYADAQNIAVRSFLYKFSKNFQFFDSEYQEKTLEYFNYRCPYTGELLTKENMAKDHVIPFNKESCGLHLYGNVLLVTKKANSAKASKTLKDFLKNEPEKYQKIYKFIRDTGYLNIHNKYNEKLRLTCNNLYNEVGEVIKETYKDFESKNISDREKTTARKIIRKINSSNTYKKTEKSILSKSEIEQICRRNNFYIRGNFTKASKNSSQDLYWANPNIDFIKDDWYLVLDDTYNQKLYCFYIPENTINLSSLKVRHDKQDLIDLQIQYNDNSFVDTRSGISFSRWLEKTISY